MSEYVLALGDVVKLKQPYRPSEWAAGLAADWPGFEFGIVAELGEGDRLSLFLYDRSGQLLITPSLAPQTLMLPTYFECHLDDLVRYQTVAESGYFLDGI
ncbi:MAG TPA: hypothetical protein IGR64_12655 [Leptolyngbyaceae cyanobacterium M65_K2018_010]|nr:hypothetical protein [Leptolyngbyaceae cyanobacterium M65_K2018_010]